MVDQYRHVIFCIVFFLVAATTLYQSPSVAGPRQKRQKKRGGAGGGATGNKQKDDSTKTLSQSCSEEENSSEGGGGGVEKGSRRVKDRGKERRGSGTFGRSSKGAPVLSSASESEPSDGDASSANLKYVCCLRIVCLWVFLYLCLFICFFIRDISRRIRLHCLMCLSVIFQVHVYKKENFVWLFLLSLLQCL